MKHLHGDVERVIGDSNRKDWYKRIAYTVLGTVGLGAVNFGSYKLGTSNLEDAIIRLRESPAAVYCHQKLDDESLAKLVFLLLLPGGEFADYNFRKKHGIQLESLDECPDIITNSSYKKISE